MKGRNLPVGAGPLNIWVYGRGLMRAYLLSLMLFLISGLGITYTSIGENAYPMMTSVILIISIAYAAIYVAVKLRAKGWLHGAVVGIVYITLIVLLSSLFLQDFAFDRFILYRYLVSIAAGSVGGMIGINIK